MDIFLCCILKFIYIRKYSCKSICKAKMNQEASEASEVSGWKLLTIAVEGFVLDAMWSLDSPLNKYLRF